MTDEQKIETAPEAVADTAPEAVADDVSTDVSADQLADVMIKDTKATVEKGGLRGRLTRSLLGRITKWSGNPVTAKLTNVLGLKKMLRWASGLTAEDYELAQAISDLRTVERNEMRDVAKGRDVHGGVKSQKDGLNKRIQTIAYDRSEQIVADNMREKKAQQQALAQQQQQAAAQQQKQQQQQQNVPTQQQQMSAPTGQQYQQQQQQHAPNNRALSLAEIQEMYGPKATETAVKTAPITTAVKEEAKVEKAEEVKEAPIVATANEVTAAPEAVIAEAQENPQGEMRAFDPKTDAFVYATDNEFKIAPNAAEYAWDQDEFLDYLQENRNLTPEERTAKGDLYNIAELSDQEIEGLSAEDKQIYDHTRDNRVYAQFLVDNFDAVDAAHTQALGIYSGQLDPETVEVENPRLVDYLLQNIEAAQQLPGVRILPNTLGSILAEDLLARHNFNAEQKAEVENTPVAEEPEALAAEPAVAEIKQDIAAEVKAEAENAPGFETLSLSEKLAVVRKQIADMPKATEEQKSVAVTAGIPPLPSVIEIGPNEISPTFELSLNAAEIVEDTQRYKPTVILPNGYKPAEAVFQENKQPIVTQNYTSPEQYGFSAVDQTATAKKSFVYSLHKN